MAARSSRVLCIAGSDSSGGAGIQADIKTITMLGGYAMTAITAVTAQDTTGVHAVEVLSPEFVIRQIDACWTDIGVDAIKIGMLGSLEIAQLVADNLLGRRASGIEKRPVPIVFDPVMVATSGAELADTSMIADFKRLMSLATVTTPNVHELEALGGDAALVARGVTYLATGGDADGPEIEDRLVVPGADPVIWRAPRIETRHNHGTGCTLSSAIATLLGSGLDLEAAISRAREFVRCALLAAPGFGQGHGPMGHGAVGQANQSQSSS